MLDVIMILMLIFLISRIILKEKEINIQSKAPIILIFIGLTLTIYIIHAYHDNLVMYAYLIATCLIGFIFGMIRGTSIQVHLNKKNQKWFKKGTLLTLVILIIGILVNISVEKLLFPKYVTGLISIMTTLHIGVSLFSVRLILKRKMRVS